MILCDANVLLYAYNPTAREHTGARNWLETALTGSEWVGFCWPVLSCFLRLSTSSRAYLDPLSMEEAIEIVNSWLHRANAQLVLPTDRHWVVFSRLLNEGKVRGPLTSDAEIAAYAIEHGASLATTDRDFSRFPGLTSFNPLGS